MRSASTRQRGDSVSVVNQSFRGETKPEDIVADKIPLWEQPLMRDMAKLLVGLIALLVLVFSVLRPMLRSLMGVPPKPDKKGKDAKQIQVQQVTAGAYVCNGSSSAHGRWQRGGTARL